MTINHINYSTINTLKTTPTQTYLSCRTILPLTRSQTTTTNNLQHTNDNSQLTTHRHTPLTLYDRLGSPVSTVHNLQSVPVDSSNSCQRSCSCRSLCSWCLLQLQHPTAGSTPTALARCTSASLFSSLY